MAGYPLAANAREEMAVPLSGMDNRALGGRVSAILGWKAEEPRQRLLCVRLGLGESDPVSVPHHATCFEGGREQVAPFTGSACPRGTTTQSHHSRHGGECCISAATLERNSDNSLMRSIWYLSERSGDPGFCSGSTLSYWENSKTVPLGTAVSQGSETCSNSQPSGHWSHRPCKRSLSGYRSFSS